MMNRSILIAGGCVVGLGGILLVTPPNFGSSNNGFSGSSAIPSTSKTTTATSKGISGTFAGDANITPYGPVQVQITVKNGKITAAKALQVPNNTFRDKSINSQAIPYLIQETLTTQTANIQGVGGASYTSAGWHQSLASALAKAGM
jgi:uncharacterized protein with FMN-binding domain